LIPYEFIPDKEAFEVNKSNILEADIFFRKFNLPYLSII